MHRTSWLALALVLTLGCTQNGPSPESFDPADPFPTYRATGGWITGELDGEPFTSVEISAYAGVTQRFPHCGTQTGHFFIEGRDGARGIRLLGHFRFFEGDHLRTGAPLIVRSFWDWVTPYQDPPPGGALVQFHVRVDDREFRTDNDVDSRVRLVEVCQAPAGPCHPRLEIEGHFRFRGTNELAGVSRTATLSVGIDLEPTIVTPNELGGPTVIWNESCPPAGSAGLGD